MRNQYKVLASKYKLVLEGNVATGDHDQNLQGAGTADTTFKKTGEGAYFVKGKFKYKGKVFEYEATLDHADNGAPLDVNAIAVFELSEDKTVEPHDVTDKFNKVMKQLKTYILNQAKENSELQLPDDAEARNMGYSFPNPYYKNLNYSDPSGKKYKNI